MINPGPAHALSELAARAQEMLSAYQPGYEAGYHDLRSATLARPKPALDPMSVSAPEAAYFIGVDKAGKPFYSRDGSLAIVDGTVSFPDGAAVLGYPAAASVESSPQRLRVDPVDAALGRVTDAHVEADGTVAYTRTAIDPKTGKPSKERVAIGRVALARFPAGSELQRISATRAVPPDGVPPTIGKPSQGSFGALATQSRDVGSVDFEAGLVQVREAFLALDAMSAGAQAEAREAKTALDLIK
jgi:hypothetical protein